MNHRLGILLTRASPTGFGPRIEPADVTPAGNHRLREWFKERDAECMALIGQLQRSQKRLQQAQARVRRAEERVRELWKGLRQVTRKEARGKGTGRVGRKA